MDGETPQSGEVYRNTKNGRDYEVVIISRSSDDPAIKLITYRALYSSKEYPHGQPWTRTLEEFVGNRECEDGSLMKRFVKIK